MRIILTLAILMAASFTTLAQTPDTPANRQAAAEQYVNESGLQQVIVESAKIVANGFTPQERSTVLRNYVKYLNKDQIRTAMASAMARRFTLDEIQAIRKFAGSPVGASIMSKLGAYSGDISPAIESASADALGKVLLEMRRQSRETNAEKK